MKNIPGLNFVLTTIIGGLVFLVPIGAVVFVMVMVVDYMVIVAQPLADWLPVDTVGGLAMANLLAIIIIVLVCFFAGLIARHSLADRFVKTLESKVLVRIPGYTIIKGIKNDFDSANTESMKAVALQLGSAERFGLEVEKLADGRSMVYIPSAPSVWSGITQILPPEQITYLDVPVTRVMELTENYGSGVQELLNASKAP